MVGHNVGCELLVETEKLAGLTQSPLGKGWRVSRHDSKTGRAPERRGAVVSNWPENEIARDEARRLDVVERDAVSHSQEDHGVASLLQHRDKIRHAMNAGHAGEIDAIALRVTEIGNCIRSVAGSEDECIRSQAAGQDVIACAAFQDIVADIGIQKIIPARTDQRVVERRAGGGLTPVNVSTPTDASPLAVPA